MVTKMDSNMRGPSPPLPPDPSNLRQPAAQPPYVAAQKSPPSTLARSPSHSPPSGHLPTGTAQQDVEEVLHRALDQAPATNQIDPEFIKQVTEQVTEQVIRSLQISQPLANGPFTIPPTSPLRAAVSPHLTQSPTQSSADSAQWRYTPPTPDRVRDERSFVSSSPEPMPSEAGSTFSRVSTESKSTDTARLARHTNSTNRTQRVPAVQESCDTGSDEDSSRSRRTDTSTVRGQALSGLGSVRSESPLSGYAQSQQNSNAPDAEETTLERIWRPLFDSNGRPTERLSQFLRGLAIYLIDEDEPKGSLVVTPAKMQRFFAKTKSDNDRYPWDAIFGGSKMTPASLSIMYRRLRCQHHFVQAQPHETPSIPGLTPVGFADFLTCLIQAHPDAEFERLARAVMHMPISNADAKAERFPKELSRRLLPAEPNLHAEQRLLSSLNHEPQVIAGLRGRPAAMPPPPASSPPRQNSVAERERQPYSRMPCPDDINDINNVDDEDDDLVSPPAVQLERERKPYIGGKQGSGKTYPLPPDNTKPPLPQGVSSKQYVADDTRPSIRADAVPSARPQRGNPGAPPPPAMFNNGGSNLVDPTSLPLRERYHPHRRSTGGLAGPPPQGPFMPTSSGSSTPVNPNYAKQPPARRPSSPPPPPSSSRPFSHSRASEPLDANASMSDDFDPPHQPLRRYSTRPRSASRSAYDDDPPPRGARPVPGRTAGGSSGVGAPLPPPPPQQYDHPVPISSRSSSFSASRPTRRRSTFADNGAPEGLSGLLASSGGHGASPAPGSSFSTSSTSAGGAGPSIASLVGIAGVPGGSGVGAAGSGGAYVSTSYHQQMPPPPPPQQQQQDSYPHQIPQESGRGKRSQYSPQQGYGSSGAR